MSLKHSYSLGSVGVALLALTGASTAHADIITGVTAINSSNLANRGAINTVNGSGLSVGGDADLATPDQTHGNVAVSGGVGSMWLTTLNDADPFITFDLGTEYVVDSFRVWNYNDVQGTNNFTNRGVQNLNILTSTTGNPTPTDSLGAFTFNKANGTTTESGQFIQFAPVTARYIKFDVNSNFGVDAGTTANNYFGISEVRFNGTVAPVPEPSTYAMMFLGVGALGLMTWKRKRSTDSVADFTAAI